MFHNKMVQGIINVGEKEDRILNIVKAQNNLKNKSQAIELIINVYADSFLEPELRDDFLVKLNSIKKQKGLRFNNIEDLKKSVEK